MENIKVESGLTFESVPFDKENAVHLVVSLIAPKKDWENERAPICLVPVIDISGSMTGDKLNYAKKSAIKLVEHLKPGDYIGLVAFSTDVYEISPCIEATSENKSKLITKIQEINAVCSTNFAGGLLKGLEFSNSADLPEKLLRRVIILTDGLANVGIATRRNELIPLLEKNLGKSSVSAFGYGADADQELLADIATKGGGNYAFIDNPDRAINAFAKELGGLLSVYAQNIQIELEMQNGHTIEKVISDVDAKGDAKKTTIKLHDILSEETQHVVTELKLSKQSQALPRATNVVALKVMYEVLNKDGSLEKREEELKTKIKFVKEGEQQEKPTEKLDEIVSMHQIVQTQLEANKMAEAGNYNGAVLKFANLTDSFKRRGRSRSAGVVANLSANYSCGAKYAGSSAYRTGVTKGITKGMGVMSYCAEAKRDMAFLNLDVDNEAMRCTEDSFTQEEPAPVIDLGVPVITTGSPIVFTPDSKKTPPPLSEINKKRSNRW